MSWPNVGPERAIPGSSPANQFHPPAPDPRIAAAPPLISESSMRQRADLERRAMQTAAAASTADRLLRNAQADFNQSCKSVEERSQSLTRAQEHMNLAQINWILRSAERKQLLLMREAVEKEMEELRGKMTRGTGASEKEAARSKSGTTQGEKAVGSPQRATRGRQQSQKQKGKEKEKQQPEEQAALEAGSSSTSNTAPSSKKAETAPSDTAHTRRSGLRRRRSSAAELDNGADGDRNGAGTSTTAAEAANTEPDPDSTISERPAKRTRRSATVAAAAAAAAATPTKSSSSAGAIPASAEPSQEGEDESEQAATQVPAPPPPTQSQAATTPSTSRRMTRSAARHA
ncbi:hypothetical protein OC842_002422 [Tilletia horrida]|uniref:Uncharacterized protein n=1 Tax=Tilletia horrida TaxID=155126 RepID=A0AAN6GDB5_9BASI|nr:hypothetical protein OC842_002422 [Tilletia horrida]